MYHNGTVVVVSCRVVAEYARFDTNTCNVSSRDDIDTTADDDDPWTVFLHTTDVLASIRELIGLTNSLHLHIIYSNIMNM